MTFVALNLNLWKKKNNLHMTFFSIYNLNKYLWKNTFLFRDHEFTKYKLRNLPLSEQIVSLCEMNNYLGHRPFQLHHSVAKNLIRFMTSQQLIRLSRSSLS